MSMKVNAIMQNIQDILREHFKQGQRFVAPEVGLYTNYIPQQVGRYLGRLHCVERVDIRILSNRSVQTVYELKTMEDLGWER